MPARQQAPALRRTRRSGSPYRPDPPVPQRRVLRLDLADVPVDVREDRRRGARTIQSNSASVAAWNSIVSDRFVPVLVLADEAVRLQPPGERRLGDRDARRPRRAHVVASESSGTPPPPTGTSAGCGDPRPVRVQVHAHARLELIDAQPRRLRSARADGLDHMVGRRLDEAAVAQPDRAGPACGRWPSRRRCAWCRCESYTSRPTWSPSTSSPIGTIPAGVETSARYGWHAEHCGCSSKPTLNHTGELNAAIWCSSRWVSSARNVSASSPSAK